MVYVRLHANLKNVESGNPQHNARDEQKVIFVRSKGVFQKVSPLCHWVCANKWRA